MLKPGATMDEKTVLNALRDRLARFKQPKGVIFAADLPRNTMGKVQKNLLRERYSNLYISLVGIAGCPALLLGERDRWKSERVPLGGKDVWADARRFKQCAQTKKRRFPASEERSCANWSPRRCYSTEKGTGPRDLERTRG